jgi:glucan phosphoethanolaminetransferase (alkaline phosphatase superfamily)
MELTAAALALIVAAGIAVWMKKDSSFRKREVAVVSIFWILVMMTSPGATFVEKVQEMFGNGAKGFSETVNNVSSK